MKIKSMILKNYRNYASLNLRLLDSINIFLGKNAQGKTNIIEAAYYSILGKSHRTNFDNELINWHEQKGYIDICFERLGIENDLKFSFDRSKRRSISYNHQVIKPKELIGLFNAVLFSPEDLSLIKGAPAGRRRFLDGEISQSSPAYYHELLNYNRLLVFCKRDLGI